MLREEKGLLEVHASEEAVTVGHVSLGAVLGGLPHSSVPLQSEVHAYLLISVFECGAVTVGHVLLGVVLGGFPHSSVPLQCVCGNVCSQSVRGKK